VSAAVDFVKAQAEAMPEAVLQQRVLHLARFLGYKAWHFHDSTRQVRRGGRYITVGDKDARGFPDTVLVSKQPPRIVYAELKKQKGRLTPEQKDALELLASAGAEVHLWRPTDLLDGTIENTLRGRTSLKGRNGEGTKHDSPGRLATPIGNA
jgi:hypothetical protein